MLPDNILTKVSFCLELLANYHIISIIRIFEEPLQVLQNKKVLQKETSPKNFNTTMTNSKNLEKLRF